MSVALVHRRDLSPHPPAIRSPAVYSPPLPMRETRDRVRSEKSLSLERACDPGSPEEQLTEALPEIRNNNKVEQEVVKLTTEMCILSKQVDEMTELLLDTSCGTIKNMKDMKDLKDFYSNLETTSSVEEDTFRDAEQKARAIAEEVDEIVRGHNQRRRYTGTPANSEASLSLWETQKSKIFCDLPDPSTLPGWGVAPDTTWSSPASDREISLLGTPKPVSQIQQHAQHNNNNSNSNNNNSISPPPPLLSMGLGLGPGGRTPSTIAHKQTKVPDSAATSTSSAFTSGPHNSDRLRPKSLNSRKTSDLLDGVPCAVNSFRNFSGASTPLGVTVTDISYGKVSNQRVDSLPAPTPHNSIGSRGRLGRGPLRTDTTVCGPAPIRLNTSNSDVISGVGSRQSISESHQSMRMSSNIPLRANSHSSDVNVIRSIADQSKSSINKNSIESLKPPIPKHNNSFEFDDNQQIISDEVDPSIGTPVHLITNTTEQFVGSQTTDESETKEGSIQKQSVSSSSCQHKEKLTLQSETDQSPQSSIVYTDRGVSPMRISKEISPQRDLLKNVLADSIARQKLLQNDLYYSQRGSPTLNSCADDSQAFNFLRGIDSRGGSNRRKSHSEKENYGQGYCLSACSSMGDPSPLTPISLNTSRYGSSKLSVADRFTSPLRHHSTSSGYELAGM